MANRAWMLIACFSLCLAGCVDPQRATLPAPPGAQAEFVPMPIPAPAPEAVQEETPTYAQSGIASWYREIGRFKRTANGEKPEPMRFTAAHRSLPFGTIVRVTSLRSGRSILVRINDRGPYAHRRIIDLSYAAAATLGILHDGVTRVSVAVYASDQCDASATSVLCFEKNLAADAVRNHKQAARRRSTRSLSARSGRTTTANPTARN
jgi:rare lipoprotein A